MSGKAIAEREEVTLVVVSPTNSRSCKRDGSGTPRPVKSGWVAAARAATHYTASGGSAADVRGRRTQVLPLDL